MTWRYVPASDSYSCKETAKAGILKEMDFGNMLKILLKIWQILIPE